jgi:hypothetical protein
MSNKPRYKEPKEFNGNHQFFDKWMLSCKIFLAAQPGLYGDDPKRIWYILSTMQSGEASNWAQQWIDSKTTAGMTTLGTLADFHTVLHDTFAPTDEAAFAHSHLKKMQEGNTPMEDFISSFKTYMRKSRITNEPVIINLFRNAINPRIATEIDLQLNRPDTIAEWYTQA